MRFMFAFLGKFAGLILVIGACWAGTIRVPEDAPSILAGVDQANTGDSVLVGPGTWTDKATRGVLIAGEILPWTSCAFLRGGISIIGVAGAEQTIVDVGSTTLGFVSNVVIVNQVGFGDVLIQGLTLTGASGSDFADAAVAIEVETITFRSCRFVENVSVLNGRNFDLEMIDCDISQNQAPEGYPLISTLESRALFENCRFRNNIGRCVSIDMEYVGAPVPHVQVKNCEFTENRSRGFGTCLDLLYGNIVVSGNLFLRNVAEEEGAAGLRASECFGNVEFNVFAYDSVLAANSSAAGILWWTSNGHVRNNTFVGCHGAGPGAAFTTTSKSWLGFENNIVSHTTGGAAIQDFGGGIIYGYPCNLFWANSGGNYGEWEISPTDLYVDPYYCGFDLLDFTVRENSPAIIGGCGQIGALGIGCEGVSIEPMSWGKIKGLYRLDR